MDLIMDIEVFDEVDEFELIEFGIPRNIIFRQNYYNSLPDYKFFKKFRLRKESVILVLQMIEDQLEFPLDINRSVSPILQLLTCLRFLAAGAHLDIIGDYMGMDATTAGRCVHRVSRAIASLYRRFVKMPSSEQEKKAVNADFYAIARFPHVIGALDCTHIKILSPGGDDAEIYRNRKDYFSINVQAICDANNNFLDVVARWPGSSHDSTIFNNSRIRGRFERQELRGNILLGDKGYALKDYLLTPLLNPITEAEQLYNESHIRTRNKIECTFGIVKRRFPVLAYGCRLQLKNVLPVIIAAVVLHNIARNQHEDEPPADLDDYNVQQLERLILLGQIPPPPAEVRPGRDNSYRKLILTYFARL